MGRRRAFKTTALFEVNEHIVVAARDSITQEQIWEFFCECGDEACAEHVRLAIDEYVGIRERPTRCSRRATISAGRSWRGGGRGSFGRSRGHCARRAGHQVRRAKKRTD